MSRAPGERGKVHPGHSHNHPAESHGVQGEPNPIHKTSQRDRQYQLFHLLHCKPLSRQTSALRTYRGDCAALFRDCAADSGTQNSRISVTVTMLSSWAFFYSMSINDSELITSMHVSKPQLNSSSITKPKLVGFFHLARVVSHGLKVKTA